MKAFFLAFTMNVVPVAPIDVLRYLRVPAIVWVMRRVSAKRCVEPRCGLRRHRRLP